IFPLSIAYIPNILRAQHDLLLAPRRLHPSLRHHTRQRDANTSSPVDPRRRRFPRQLLAEVAREMVAVPREDVIGGALELFGGFAKDLFELGWAGESEAVEDLGAPCATGRFLTRFHPVDA